MFNIGRPSYLQALVNLFQQKSDAFKSQGFHRNCAHFSSGLEKVQVVHMYFK